MLSPCNSFSNLNELIGNLKRHRRHTRGGYANERFMT